MLQQYHREGKETLYVKVAGTDNILTEDGVLIDSEEFDDLSIEEYKSLVDKTSKNGNLYDYKLFRETNKLKKISLQNIQDKKSYKKGETSALGVDLKTMINKSNDANKDWLFNPSFNPRRPISGSKEPEEPEVETLTVKAKPTVKKTTKKTTTKKSSKPKTTKPKVEHKGDTETFAEHYDSIPLPTMEKMKETPEVKKEAKGTKTVETKEGAFTFFAPYFALLTTITCSCLSIWFTGSYLTVLQTTLIAFIYSSILLIFELIGSQFAQIYFKKGKFGFGLLLAILTVVVTAFSMWSAVDVNYSKYIKSHALVVEKQVEIGKNTANFDLIKAEIEDNKAMIEQLNKDIDFQQTQNTPDIVWTVDIDHPKGYNKDMGTRSLTKRAQEAITLDKQQIAELQNKNKELNRQLRELVDEGVNNIEGTINNDTSTLTDLLAKLLHLPNGNVIQLIILLIPSAFVDLVSIASLTIYRDMKDKKREK